MCFVSRDAQGATLYHHFRLASQGLMPDNSELMAQGREAENAQRKRDFNRLPCFANLDQARQAFQQGLIPGSYGDWNTWRHCVSDDLDNFRQDYRVRRGLAA